MSELSRDAQVQPTVWWRTPMMWLVIGGPAAVVVASFATLALAILNPDPVITAAPTAFLVAAVLEMAVFAWVDPQSLHTLAGAQLGLSDLAIYSIAFLGFWVCTTVACGLAVLLERSAADINSEPLADN
jgi:hypothetical protein